MRTKRPRQLEFSRITFKSGINSDLNKTAEADGIYCNLTVHFLASDADKLFNNENVPFIIL
jgi:hypothetical protein